MWFLGYALSVLHLQEASIRIFFQRPWISSHFFHAQWKQNHPDLLISPPEIFLTFMGSSLPLLGMLVMMGPGEVTEFHSVTLLKV